MQCVHKSEQTPAAPGELRIFNQIMEIFSANKLAEKCKKIGNELGYNIQINHLDNPRKEAEEHYYNPTYQGLIKLGVKPHYLTDEVLKNLFKIVDLYKNNIRQETIFKGIKW